MRVWPLALVFGGGCAQLFGLDVTTSAPDANPGEVSLAVQRVSIGSTVVKAPQDMNGQMATFYVDDGTGVFTATPGTLIPPNKFTAPLMTGTPPVEFTLPGDMIPRFFASSRNQIVNHVEFERPGMVPAAATSKITVGINLPSAYVSGEAFNVVAIGPWTQHPLAAGELPAPDMGIATIGTPPIDYTTGFSNLIPNAMTRAKITSADYVLVLRTVGSRLTGYLETQLDQTDANDTISGSMTAVTTNRTLNATIDPTGYATRFSAALPAVTGLNLSYSIAASPGADVGQTRGIQLTAGGSAMMDTMVTTMYGNPFEGHGWKSVVTYTATSSRTFTFMTAPIGLGATMQTISDPEQTMAITLPAGLPFTVKANGTDLVTDGMDLPLDLTKPVTLTASIDKPTATYYSLALSEITVTGMTAARTIVISAASTNPSFQIPQSYFTVGHTYVVQFRAHEGGYLDAAGGDFASFTLPLSTSALDSAVFTVVAP